jgi:hypothetical protein
MMAWPKAAGVRVLTPYASAILLYNPLNSKEIIDMKYTWVERICIDVPLQPWQARYQKGRYGRPSTTTRVPKKLIRRVHWPYGRR